jgi:SAM-dependent methyltransferase
MDALEFERMDRVEAELWWYRALHVRLISELAGVQGKILDAGCGTGGFLRTLAGRRPDLVLTGCERDGFAAALARKKGCSVVAGSVHGLPFADRQFDAVVSADVLCHSGVEPHPALLEMRRVLRPGGLLVVNMPAFMWLFSAHDLRVSNVRRVSRPQLRELLRQAGFETPKIWYWNSFLLPLMILRRKFLARREGAESDVAPVNKYLNAAFFLLLGLERRISALPADGSVMAVAVTP